MKIIKVSFGQKIVDSDAQFQHLFYLLCPSSSVTTVRKENYQTWNCSSPVKALIFSPLPQFLGVLHRSYHCCLQTARKRKRDKIFTSKVNTE